VECDCDQRNAHGSSVEIPGTGSDRGEDDGCTGPEIDLDDLEETGHVITADVFPEAPDHMKILG
jgi:hypothetical protein